eukprot:scaffold114760_cov29-Tisochrysis_lutea.AAC.5
MEGRYEGISSPSCQGPDCAVAPSCPSAAARSAASASADGGRPSTSALSVSVSLNALVASSRLLEKAVDASASERRLALNFSLASPVSPTPESFMPMSDWSMMRRCVSSSSSDEAIFSTALNTGTDWPSLVVTCTTLGCISECA